MQDQQMAQPYAIVSDDIDTHLQGGGISSTGEEFSSSV